MEREMEEPPNYQRRMDAAFPGISEELDVEGVAREDATGT